MRWAVFPSGNSEAAQACANAWRDAGWRVAVLIDADQPDVRCDMLVRETDYRGTAAAFNKLMRTIRDWTIAICVNDDMFPLVCRSDHAEAVFSARFPDGNGIIQPAVKGFPDLAPAVSPIIGRAYGVSPWHEGYWHLHCDDEIRDVAQRSHLFAYAPELLIDHRHKSIGYADTLPAEKRRRNDAQHAADAALYLERKAAGFP